MATEITLELAEQYLLDRCNELLNYDVAAGTPFIFISGLTLLNVLERISPDVEEFLPSEYSRIGLRDLLIGLVYNFSLAPYIIELTHKNEYHLHLNYKEKMCLAAGPFIQDIKNAVPKVFNKLREDKVLAAAAYVTLNRNKFVGYGD